MEKMLSDLARLRDGRSKRFSSWNKTGKNRDCLTIKKGEIRTIAEIKRAGIIRHIWVTIACEDEFYLRKILLRAYWDGESSPSIDSPIGDFFGVGHARVSSFSSAVLNMSAKPGPNRAAMNCYFPMPFARAKIEVVNESDTPIRSFYYYIDYDELDKVPEDQGRFHAKWRRDNPCKGWWSFASGRPRSKEFRAAVSSAANLTDAENYLFLEARGRGHYVGTVLSVHNLCGGWWGEGDDMFMIDGRKWPPDLHGTGSEDYFSHAWGMQPQNAYIYNGVSFHQPGTAHSFNERITVYRFHLAEPVIFHKSLRASIEHGHANNRSDDYSSVAYWYQTEPHCEFEKMLPVEERLPRPDIEVVTSPAPGPRRPNLRMMERMARGLKK